MSRLFQKSKSKIERHCEVGKPHITVKDNQTAEFLAAIKREKLRVKLAQNGEDLH